MTKLPARSVSLRRTLVAALTAVGVVAATVATTATGTATSAAATPSPATARPTARATVRPTVRPTARATDRPPADASGAPSASQVWSSLRDTLAGIKGEWNDQTYPGGVSTVMPDTALIGNGDVGVTSGGSTGVKTFTVSKGDFWNGNPSPTPAPIGGVTLQSTTKPLDTDLALGAVATASSVFGADTPDRAVDGGWTQGYEGWVSDVGPTQWIALDLGSVQDIGRIVVKNDDAARPGNDDHTTKDLTVQTSTDGRDWTDADTVTGNTAAIIDETITPVATRYLRLYITAPTQGTTPDSTQNPRARIGEIQLFGPTDDPDEALGAVATASSVLGSDTPDRAVNDRWASGYEGWVSDIGKPQWITLDLGSPRTVARYVVKNDDAARPGNDDHTTKDVQFQTSTDGQNWTDVDTVTGNTAAVIDRDITPVTTRYVRFYTTEPTQDTTPDSIQNPRARFGQIQLFGLPKTVEDPDAAPPSGPFREEEDIVDGHVRTSMTIDDTPLTLDTFLAPDSDVLVTSVTSDGSAPVRLQSSTWAGADADQNPAFGNTAGTDGDTMWAERATAPGGPNWICEAALATRIIGAAAVDAPHSFGPTALTDFTLDPGQTADIVTGVAGGGQNPGDQVAPATALSQQTPASVAALDSAGAAWWKDYWMRSSVDVGDPTLMRYYYAAQYFLGSASRPGKQAPALYGIWTTTDTPKYSGDYHLNYNAVAPFYGAYSSNRPELAQPLYDVINDYIPEAEHRAQTDLTAVNPSYVGSRFPSGGVPSGVLYPVGIGPDGSTTTDGYYEQVGDSLFSATAYDSYWQYTRDTTWFENTALTYLTEVADFFQNYLEWDSATNQYVLWSGAQENLWGENASDDLGMLKDTLATLVDATTTIGIDAAQQTTWQQILDHLPAQPTDTYDGKTVYALAEPGTLSPDARSIHPGDNTVNLEFIQPAGVLGINGPAADRQTAIDTIDAMNSWGQENSFVKVFTQAAAVGYPAAELIAKLDQQIQADTVANLAVQDNDNGIEKVGATAAVNDMLVQSDRGVMDLFADWPAGQDASFYQLRTPGAFVVSSALRQGTVRYLSVTSTAGGTLAIANPWPGHQVAATDGHGRTTLLTAAGGVLRLPTDAGAGYSFRPLPAHDPSAAATVSGQHGNLGWITAGAQVSLSGHDADGDLASLRYQLDGGAWTTYTQPVALPDGRDTITYQAVDSLGDTSQPRSIRVDVDATAPTVTAATVSRLHLLTASARDATSGVALIQYSVDGGRWLPLLLLAVVPPGAHRVLVRAIDVAGNVGVPVAAS